MEHLHVKLRLRQIPHEIVVVDDGSMDRTWDILARTKERVPVLRAVQNAAFHGFGRAIIASLDVMEGDAVVIMMADESDDTHDVVRYWNAETDLCVPELSV